MNICHWILYGTAGMGMRKGRNVGTIVLTSLKAVKFSKVIGLFSTTCKINAYCINRFTKMPPVELIHIFESHLLFFPLGLTSSCVFMAFYSFLKQFVSTVSAARE